MGNRTMQKSVLVIMSIVLFTLTAACGVGNENNTRNEGRLQTTEITENGARIPLLTFNNKPYFPVDDFTKATLYNTEWNEASKTLSIGDIDVVYKLTLNSNMAEKEGDTIRLADPPIQHNGKLYAPLTVLDELFGDEINAEVQGQNLILLPAETTDQDAPDVDSFFQDDPNDPFKGEDTGETDHTVNAGVTDQIPGEGQVVPVALRNINMRALVRRAKRYLGVRYEFGAAPYPVSKAFDCSSYTKFVYSKFGVRLARTSRDQAKQGRKVLRTNLRKGDLMFFSVPGRYRNNNRVGHVGIYIGNRRMIHTFPSKEGVQITPINRDFWVRNYLTSRRVAR